MNIQSKTNIRFIEGFIRFSSLAQNSMQLSYNKPIIFLFIALIFSIGIFTFAIAFASMFLIFSNFGLSDITTRELAKNKSYIKSDDAKEKVIRLLSDVERIQVMFKDIDDSMSLVMKNGEIISEISGEILTIREEVNLAMMKIESLIEGIIR